MISVQNLGGPTAVARMVKLSVPTVHGWKNIPDRHCPAIERETLGKWTCEAMRPDLTWRRIPDPTWPHPQGRPLMDFAAKDEAADAQESGDAAQAQDAKEAAHG